MEDTNKIGLEAVLELLGFHQSVDEYNNTLRDTTGRTDSAGSSMSAVFEGLSSVGAIAFEAIGIGIAAMAAELYLAVDAAMDAEEAMARVDFVVAGTAERTGVTTEAVGELAGSLSKVLPIDDEVIAQAIAMGLTFDGVNKDNIQPLIGAAADLAAWTGRDLPSTMKSLALAISDPEKAMRLLKEANITLTDDQSKTLKAFKDTGDSAGATTFILEQLKKKGIIGLGQAMGDTAKGKMTIMQTALGNIQEALGGGFLNALGEVFDRITSFAGDTKTLDFFTELGVKIGEFAGQVLDKLPSIADAIQGVATWFTQNKPIIVGVLAAIGVAMVAFGYTAAAGLWPVIAVMAAVGLVVGVLYKAWTENWGGIQEKVAAAWTQMKPVFDKLQAWLAVNVPKAIKALSKFWTDTLLPAIKTAFNWIADNVIPILVKLILWLGDNVPKAIKTLSDFWKNTLLPAIKNVYDFIEGTLIPNFKSVVSFISGAFSSAIKTLSSIWTGTLLPAITAIYNFFSTYIMPVFNAVSNLASAVLGVAVRALAGLWQNVLQPALSSVWGFIQGNIMPIFTSVSSTMNGVLSSAIKGLSNLWKDTFLPAITMVWDKLKPFRDFLANVFTSAVNGIKDAFFSALDKINGLADALRNLQLPDWLTPGSPTPLEMGLRGINNELERLSRSSMPALASQMNSLSGLRDVPGSSGSVISNSVSNSNQSTNNHIYGAQFNIPGPSGFVETLQGLT